MKTLLSILLVFLFVHVSEAGTLLPNSDCLGDEDKIYSCESKVNSSNTLRSIHICGRDSFHVEIILQDNNGNYWGPIPEVQALMFQNHMYYTAYFADYVYSLLIPKSSSTSRIVADLEVVSFGTRWNSTVTCEKLN